MEGVEPVAAKMNLNIIDEDELISEDIDIDNYSDQFDRFQNPATQ